MNDHALTEQAQDILRALKRHRLVLLSGPPAVGKTTLLTHVRRLFEAHTGFPAYRMDDKENPFPDEVVLDDAAAEWFPSADRPNHRTFQTAFHPGFRYRDFMRGLSPAVGTPGAFSVSKGVMYNAAEFARASDNASLLIVDEINRGPAVQIFGDSIVGIEGDKRADCGGATPFQVMQDDGSLADYVLPGDLYILGAMNQADTSVEPLDVAFLRRWHPVRLVPDPSVLVEHFGVEDLGAALPSEPAKPTDVYAAAIRAWASVNRRISLARGPEFQLGHGVFPLNAEPPHSVGEALQLVSEAWERIRTHIDEVFFGNLPSVAAVLNAAAPDNPIKLREAYFADAPVSWLEGSGHLYKVLLAVAEEDA